MIELIIVNSHQQCLDFQNSLNKFGFHTHVEDTGHDDQNKAYYYFLFSDDPMAQDDIIDKIKDYNESISV